jgi:hypothetical protein
MISNAQFREVQRLLRVLGNPDDPCGRCGCKRVYHLPARTFSYAKSGGSSGKSREISVQAPTSCDCKFCFCFCVAFVEPFPAQPFRFCLYDPQHQEDTSGEEKELQLTA